VEKNKNIALVAHDNRKKDLIEWVEWNCRTLLHHHLICTGTTGKLIEKTLTENAAGFCRQFIEFLMKQIPKVSLSLCLEHVAL